MRIMITIDLDSLDQARAVESALELYVDMESDRANDAKSNGFTPEDRARLNAAKQVLGNIKGHR